MPSNNQQEKKLPVSMRQWLKNHSVQFLSASCLLLALSYVLTYTSGMANNPTAMYLSAGVLFVSCLLPALL